MDLRTGAAAPSFSRRWRWLAAALGVGLLLVGIGRLVLRMRHGGMQTEQAAAKQAPRDRLSWQSPPAAPPAGQEAEAAAGQGPRFDPTTCWRDLDRFNEAVTIKTFRAWAAALLASEDEHVLGYLKERLSELIGADAAQASEVLGWVRDASPKEAGVFLSALRGSAAVHSPQVAAQLTAMSLDSRIPLERRAGLLLALDTQERFSPAVLGKLAELAKDPGSGEAGWAATRTIGRVMATDFNRTGESAPYLEKLLAIGTQSADDDIRYLAVSLPMHADPILDSRATELYARVLSTEGSANGRDAAAHLLSLSEDKAKVLRIFAQAFQRDADVCVRWALFRFAARAAGRAALPTMAEMAVADPRFLADYQIFEQIYESGVVDFERVWLALPSQDPHDCLHRPD